MEPALGLAVKLLPFQNSPDRQEKFLSNLNGPVSLFRDNVFSDSIITNIANFKKPVQVPAMFLLEFSCFNEMLVNQRDDPAMFVSKSALSRRALAA